MSEISAILMSIKAGDPHAAEKLLPLSGYQGMHERESRIPVDFKHRYRESVGSLIQFYTVTEKPAEVAAWQKRWMRLRNDPASGKTIFCPLSLKTLK